MAKPKPILTLIFLLLTLFFAAHAIQESRSEVVAPPYLEKVTKFSTTEQEDDILTIQDKSKEKRKKNGPRRLMIGSTAPTCTYNECRGCRYRCRAEQVPVEGNDPINSAYHYRCVCHR